MLKMPGVGCFCQRRAGKKVLVKGFFQRLDVNYYWMDRERPAMQKREIKSTIQEEINNGKDQKAREIPLSSEIQKRLILLKNKRGLDRRSGG